jgi:hypothetical protein
MHSTIVPAKQSLIERTDVFRLKAFLTSYHGKLNTLTVTQTPMTISTNGTKMYKYVITAVTLNEAETFGIVKPLYDTLFACCHFKILKQHFKKGVCDVEKHRTTDKENCKFGMLSLSFLRIISHIQYISMSLVFDIFLTHNSHLLIIRISP